MPNHHHDYQSSSSSEIPKHNSISTIIISLIIKPIIMLLILSIFLFIGIAAISTIILLIAGSSLHLCRRRRHTPRITSHVVQKHLPRFKYQGGVDECAVCLESIERGEWCRRLTECGHVFHVKCVDLWLVRVPNCPVCRSPLCFNNSSLTSIHHHQHLYHQQSSDDVVDEFSLWWAVAV